jgi:Glycosyl transferase family 2
MSAEVSVILCAHNPRRDYLDRVLQSLRIQTLSNNRWEFLLVDNASEKQLSLDIDLSWHSHARHIREEQLGLTPARLRGIYESQSDIIIFVDDDNILDSEYLELALEISNKYSHIGAWGGQITPEFETEPAEWTKPYWSILAIREFDRDQWSNCDGHNDSTPCGAGLCLRRAVAEKYAYQVKQSANRNALGRKGNQLTSCEDSDLAFTSCDMGLGTGQFTALKLTHLIPTSRIQEEYLLRLMEGISYSGTHLTYLRKGRLLPRKRTWSQKILGFLRSLKMSQKEKNFYFAQVKGEQKAVEEILGNCESE